ncbi:unnamed protein product [Adineta ricciae]|uniref:VLIG-type G domain-containing protein n=1 Tax=Adineta ricciae TaxID=249248 RepID=A0A815RUS5_ADIRI|nr:unnamed protein product [Adineta ricciae]CAF1482797.1 unnamed protein product [Adineta ricciae]
MTCLLLSVARCSDEKKRQHVMSLLATIFTEGKLQEILLHSIHLDEVVLDLIRKAHAARKDPSSLMNSSQSDFDIALNTPIIPLKQLPSYLIALMKASIDHSQFSTKNFEDKIIIHIGKSLRHASKLCSYEQELVQMKEVLQKYGWLNEFDGFTVPLTQEGFQALFLAMNDIFYKKDDRESELPFEIPDLPTINTTTTQETDTSPASQSDISTNISQKDNRILYTYNDWLVDRPLPTPIQFVQRLIDILRHRLDIESVLLSNCCDISTSNSLSTAKMWANRRSHMNSVLLKERISTSLHSTPSSFKTVYDILIYLLHHSDLLSQIELFRLLMERRVALPLLTPTNHDYCLYKYHINPLMFITTKLIGEREFNLSADISLYRIAIISMRPVKEQESIQWMQHAFSCQSLSSSDVVCIPLDRCIAEIGIGFVPDSTIENKVDNYYLKYEEMLVLNVIGNYSSIWPYISNFADLLLVEELPTEKVSFSPPGPLPDHVNIITWKTANSMSEPIITENNYFHLSGSILQVVKHIHEAIIHSLKNDDFLQYQQSHLRLSQMHYRELYAKRSIKSLDIESTVCQQNFFKLRSDELRLQKQFVEEAEYCRRQREDKSLIATQETLQRAINNCRQERKKLAQSIESHPLIKCFLGILSHPQAYQRALNTIEFAQLIDRYSRTALQDIIERKNRALDNYNPDNPNSTATQTYFQAKRLYVDSIIGLEHLWREISHLYTANPTRYKEYPALAAKHLIDGFPLEILDGDAAMLNQTWIQAVFQELENQLKCSMKGSIQRPNDVRVFVLSILGEQSSGKSTLLNWMYGTRLRASAGMTTKGVHIQLLKAENREEYDYVLVLDTEGINAPEYKGLPDATARDNRLATFAILPADATIVLINNEADQVARDVLSIVMLAYYQSEFAIQTAGRLNSKIFFVHTRVDVNDTAKLSDKIEFMFIELKNNAASLQRRSQQGTKTDDMIFRDFRRKGCNDCNESDVKFLGKINYANLPPKDIPDPNYGQSVIELKEYIYKRVVNVNEDDSKWKAKMLSTVSSYFSAAWQCILITDFTLTFKSLMSRQSYDGLQVYLGNSRAKLAICYSSKYSEFESKLLVELRSYQTKTEDIEHETCQNLIHRYHEEFTATVQQDAISIYNTVLQDLKEKDKLWQEWFVEEKKNWETFHNSQKARSASRIEQLITARLMYDKKLIDYQQKIRMAISKAFHGKTIDEKKELSEDTVSQESEFDKIYNAILHDSKTRQQKESVETSIYNTYNRNHLGKDFDFSKKFNEKRHKSGKTGSLLRPIDLLLSCFSNTLSQTDDEAQFFRELGEELNALLISVRRYEDGVTQSAINLTEKQLQNYRFARIKIRERAHQSVYHMLVEHLTRIHNEWENSNSISVRLENAKENLRNFFQHTIKGVVGADLLRIELKSIFKTHWKCGFIYSIGDLIINNLQSESWANNSRVLLAYADLELLDLIEQGKIDVMIQKATNVSTHYQDIIHKLISNRVSQYTEQRWPSYRKMLVDLLQLVVLKTTTYRNPICKETENDQIIIGKGRTKFFLNELCNSLMSKHLPHLLFDSIQSLNIDDYEICDAQSTEIWLSIVNDVISTFPNEKVKFTLSETEMKTMIDYICNSLINNQENESIRLRCTVPCPICKLPCKRAAGHHNSPNNEKRRHDCDHQPTGLGGDYWETNALNNYNELCYEACGDVDINRMMFTKDGKSYFYSEFSKQYDWKQPLPLLNHSLDIRKYIFYNYQKQLAELYGRLPCSKIPIIFNRTSDQLDLLKAQLKHIIDAN